LRTASVSARARLPPLPPPPRRPLLRRAPEGSLPNGFSKKTFCAYGKNNLLATVHSVGANFLPRPIKKMPSVYGKYSNSKIWSWFFEKTAIFRRKLAKIAENCDHSNDPWSHYSHPPRPRRRPRSSGGLCSAAGSSRSSRPPSRCSGPAPRSGTIVTIFKHFRQKLAFLFKSC
jgi:hypothetical protein